MGGSRARKAITILEILVVLTLIALAAGPIIDLGRANVRKLRTDRLRAAVETLCFGLTERFGQGTDDVERLLDPTADPRVFEARDLWERAPSAFGPAVILAIERLEAEHNLTLTVRLTRDVRPGVDMLVCKASWKVRSGVVVQEQEVSHGRLVLGNRITQGF